MRLLDHISDDWAVRLPYRVRHSRYTGLSRPCHALICFTYYLIKSTVILSILALFLALKFIVWDVWLWMLRRRDLYDEDGDKEEDEEEVREEDEDAEELPFCQLFPVGSEMCLLVDHVEMCPDETAFIRVVDDEGYTPLYKRKVRRDKLGGRYLVFDGNNYYLNDSKTRPIVSGRK